MAAELARVEQRIRELLRSPVALLPSHSRVHGDLLHARVTLLAARAADYREDHRFTIAAAAELMHLGRQVHRDVGDAGAFGRGRPVPRLGLGDGLAVLTGDCYLARAIRCIAELGDIMALRGLVDTAERMFEGEVAELARAGSLDLDRASALRIIELRAAWLLGWCCAVGDLVAPAVAAALRTYGRALGCALQVVDELRDCTLNDAPGAPRPGQELRDGKLALPVLLACAHSTDLRATVAALLRGPAPLDEPRIVDILERVAAAGGLDEARTIAASHLADAHAALGVLPPSAACEALAELARDAPRARACEVRR